MRWWTLDPWTLAMPALWALLYARRARTLARRGRPVPRPRQTCVYAGIATVAIALVSPLDALGEERLFWVHMAQHLLLGDIAPLLVVAGLSGATLRPVLAVRPIRALRVLGHPLVALPLWAVDLCLWHLPVLYRAALAHPAVHALEHISFFTCGALMWAALLEPLPAPRWFGAGYKALYVLAVRTVGGVLGSVFIWAGHPVYGFYAAGERRAGVDPLTDQTIAGALMFTEGAIVTLGAFGWLFLKWMREAEIRQRLLDAGGDPVVAQRAGRYGRVV